MVEKSFKGLPNVGAVHIAAVNAIDNAQRTWRARVRAGKMARGGLGVVHRLIKL